MARRPDSRESRYEIDLLASLRAGPRSRRQKTNEEIDMSWEMMGKRWVWVGTRTPAIDLKLKGLNRGEGRGKDRLRISAVTRDRALFEAREEMLKDLRRRGIVEPLRVLYDAGRNQDAALLALEETYKSQGIRMRPFVNTLVRRIRSH